MNNILEGVQFRLPHAKFPHWNPQDPYVLNDTYGDWVDVPVGMVTFAKATQLRAKPTITYQVSTSSITKTYRNKADALESMTSLVSTAVPVTMRMVDSPLSKNLGPERKLQARLGHADTANWDDFVLGLTPLTIAQPITFRIRPDYYHIVTTQDRLIKGSIEFHDIDKLAKYIDNRLRTEGLDFSVSKLKY